MKIDGTDVEEMSKEELAEARKAIDAAIRNYEDRRRREVQAKLESIAKEHGFNLNDFSAGKARASKGGSGGIPKYAHPENPSLTWTGRGRQPDWFKKALEDGKTREDMAL
jgi:DNA-binding protein H-NS